MLVKYAAVVSVDQLTATIEPADVLGRHPIVELSVMRDLPNQSGSQQGQDADKMEGFPETERAFHELGLRSQQPLLGAAAVETPCTTCVPSVVLMSLSRAWPHWALPGMVPAD